MHVSLITVLNGDYTIYLFIIIILYAPSSCVLIYVGKGT